MLGRIPRGTDAQIARELGLTYDAFRYRVRRIYAKLNAHSRDDAVHRARARGILPRETTI